MICPVVGIIPVVDRALYPLMCSVACSVVVVMQLVASSSDVTGAILACCINGPIAVPSVIGELASVTLLQT